MISTVAVTGASGFIGREIVRALQARNLHVIALGRSPERLGFPSEVETRRFDPNEPVANPGAFEGADAVVHLSGETIDGRWTPEKKRLIRTSRIEGTRRVVASLAACKQRPAVLVPASAVGYYGSRGDDPLFERSGPGSDFLAGVCVQWEAAAREAEALGIRTVPMRTGVVLGDGGALAKLRIPFRYGLGGPLGSGRQFMPWIHVRDLAAMLCFAIENASIVGPMNAVAPDYATNARFAQALGAALGRPALIPAPAFALGAVLGEFAQTILGSQLVIPSVAADAGFAWSYPHLEAALAAIFDPTRADAGIHTLRSTQFVPRPLEEVFAFFSDPRNLQRLTPPSLSFSIRNAPQTIERGSIIDYALRLHGIPLGWKTLIAEYEPMRRFVDVQLHGPYALWRHTHEFRAVEGGVEIADTVDYALPFAPFGEFAAPFVRRDVQQIFRFREQAIADLFGVASQPSHPLAALQFVR